VVQGDLELLKEIVSAFLDEYPKMLSDLTRAVHGKEAKEVQRLAHLIKGSMRYLGAKGAFERADELETMGRESQLDGTDVALDRLRDAVEQITPDLSEFVATGKPLLASPTA
jgi:HPt (histidine-containing phosphotransfer) domain-containing protein